MEPKTVRKIFVASAVIATALDACAVTAGLSGAISVKAVGGICDFSLALLISPMLFVLGRDIFVGCHESFGRQG